MPAIWRVLDTFGFDRVLSVHDGRVRGCHTVFERLHKAGGDIVTGAATVILAMGAGKQVARAIHAYLSGK